MTEANVDFWQSASEAPVPEPPKISFADVPDKAWVIVNNATREQKEGAQPKIITVSGVNGGADWFKLKTAFLVTGGDDKIKPAHIGRYIFFECSTHRNPEKDNPAMPCSGPLYNYILDALDPSDDPAPARWARVRAILTRKATEMSLTPETCNGDMQYFTAVLFKEVLLDQAYTVLGQTYTPKAKPGKSFQPGQTMGSITANTPANVTEKKVKLIDKPAEDGGF